MAITTVTAAADPRACRIPMAEFDHLTLAQINLFNDLLKPHSLTEAECHTLVSLLKRRHPPIYDDPRT